MKCTKCGAELRVNSEEYCKDVKGRPMYKYFAYCDACRIKYDISAQNPPMSNNYNSIQKNS